MYTREPFSTLFCKEEGYALPMVIVIALIISVITMSIAFSVREKIAVALELMDRNTAYLKSYSAMNEVVYNILTSTFTRAGMEIRQEDGIVIEEWNLYGQPIELSEGVTVRLKDISGMIPLPFGSRYFRALMMNESQDSKKVNAFADAFADWQDKDDLKRLNGAEAFDYRAGI
jgi:general secretion pathway protein K